MTNSTLSTSPYVPVFPFVSNGVVYYTQPILNSPPTVYTPGLTPALVPQFFNFLPQFPMAVGQPFSPVYPPSLSPSPVLTPPHVPPTTVDQDLPPNNDWIKSMPIGFDRPWLEIFWYSFSQKFSPDSWQMDFVPMEPVGSHEMYRFSDRAKVRFICETCGNPWTSMKGIVNFWYHKQGPHGYLYIQKLGQKCNQCRDAAVGFERPLWYPEEVERVLNNVFNKIGQVYYLRPLSRMNKLARIGKPRSEHNSELCEGCARGTCARKRTLSALDDSSNVQRPDSHSA